MCYQKADTLNPHMNNSEKENIFSRLKNDLSLHAQFYTMHVSSYMKNETNCLKAEECVNGNYQLHKWHKGKETV